MNIASHNSSNQTNSNEYYDVDPALMIPPHIYSQSMSVSHRMNTGHTLSTNSYFSRPRYTIDHTSNLAKPRIAVLLLIFVLNFISHSQTRSTKRIQIYYRDLYSKAKNKATKSLSPNKYMDQFDSNLKQYLTANKIKPLNYFDKIVKTAQSMLPPKRPSRKGNCLSSIFILT